MFTIEINNIDYAHSEISKLYDRYEIYCEQFHTIRPFPAPYQPHPGAINYNSQSPHFRLFEIAITSISSIIAISDHFHQLYDQTWTYDDALLANANNLGHFINDQLIILHRPTIDILRIDLPYFNHDSLISILIPSIHRILLTYKIS